MTNHPPFDSKFHAVNWYINKARYYKKQAVWNQRQAEYFFQAGLGIARQNGIEDFYFQRLQGEVKENDKNS